MSSRSEIAFREDPFKACAELIFKSRYVNKRTGLKSKKLDRNTYLETENPFDGVFFLRLHKTRILEFHANGSIVLNSGGWRTVTTKDRMNKFLPGPWSVNQERGVWFLNKRTKAYCYRNVDTDEVISDEEHSKIPYDSPEYDKWVFVSATYEEFPFDDGITIHVDGSVTGLGEDPNLQHKRAKAIRKYAKGFAEAFVNGEIPAPSQADCMFCAIVGEGGKPIGEAFKDLDHLELHMKERYYVPSLLVRASNTVATSRFYKQVLFSWMTNTNTNASFGSLNGLMMNRDIRTTLASYLQACFGLSQRRTCTAMGS